MKIALSGVVLLGVCGVFFFGYFTVQDFALLQRAFATLDELIARDADMKALFIAEFRQNAHRINVFADGTWAMLSALIAVIGLHGLAFLKHQSMRET
jgi:hypothetical protein